MPSLPAMGLAASSDRVTASLRHKVECMWEPSFTTTHATGKFAAVRHQGES